jgi:hypothetical protein
VEGLRADAVLRNAVIFQVILKILLKLRANAALIIAEHFSQRVLVSQLCLIFPWRLQLNLQPLAIHYLKQRARELCRLHKRQQ